MKTIRELRGTAVSRMKLAVALRPEGFVFDDETIASVRGAFEEFVSSLPGEVVEMSITYSQPDHYNPA